MSIQELNARLLDAATRGDVDDCQDLIAQGANVDFKNRYGVTSLHRAARLGHFAVCHLLINVGADVNTTDNNDRWSPLHDAAYNGHTEVCLLLVKAKAVIGPIDSDGNTPLHLAALNGHADVCQVLVKARVDVNITDTRGWTPLHYAARHGHADVCQVLVDRGAVINATNNDGSTPLDLAIDNYSTEVLVYFYLHHVVNFHAPDHTGMRPWDRITEDERTALNQAARDRTHAILALRSTVLPKDLSNYITRFL